MDSPLQDVAHVIQLSVAPVFLLTSVGTILGVLSTRLARIVDRARLLGERASKATAPGDAEAFRSEMRILAKRRHFVNVAITAGVIAALFVCLLIAVAFVGSIVRANLSILVAVLFVAAMVAFVTALISFLREVLVAVASVRIDPD